LHEDILSYKKVITRLQETCKSLTKTDDPSVLMKDIISQHQLLCRSAEVLSSDLFDIVIEFVYVCINKLALCWKCSRNICNFSKYIIIFADLDLRSCWIVFNHVVWEHSSGLLQFSNGEAVMILASVSSGIRTMWPNMERCHAWTEFYYCCNYCSLLPLSYNCRWFILPAAQSLDFCLLQLQCQRNAAFDAIVSSAGSGS